jgi:hypothetical protein
MTTRLSLADAAVVMGLPNDEPFSRPRDLDSVVQIEGRIKAHRWRKPSRYAMRRLRKAVDPYGKPLTLKRIFDVLDGPFGDRVGVMVLAISDAADGKRTMLATVEALRLTGLHDGLIDVLEARAIAADADVIAINATHAATRLAAIDRGYDVQDRTEFAKALLHQVGNHVGHAIDLDTRYAFDAPSALGMWAEGCDWITHQLNTLLPLVSDARMLGERLLSQRRRHHLLFGRSLERQIELTIYELLELENRLRSIPRAFVTLEDVVAGRFE